MPSKLKQETKLLKNKIQRCCLASEEKKKRKKKKKTIKKYQQLWKSFYFWQS